MSGTTGTKWHQNKFLAFREGVSYQTLSFPGAAVKFEDDFINTQIQTAAAGVVGWTLKDTGAATEAITANQPGGVVTLALANNDEKEEAGLYFGDALNFNIDKGIVFEARINVSVLPTLLAELYFGFANAYVEGTLAAADQGPTIHACFMLDGSGTITIHTDDTSTDNNAVATGVTAVAGTALVFRIVLLDPTDVRFYINDARVASTTTFDMSNGSNVVVQPYLMCFKSAGAGVGSLAIDYVKMYQLNR